MKVSNVSLKGTAEQELEPAKNCRAQGEKGSLMPIMQAAQEDLRILTISSAKNYFR